MKTEKKILIGFLSIIILIFAQVAITHKLQSDILENTRQIQNVEAPLEVMVEQVIGYNAMLTGAAHAALLHAQKNELDKVKEYKTKYDEIGTKLDNILKHDAKMLLEQSERPQEIKNEIEVDLKRLDEVNLALVDLETRAFDAMQKGDIETAYSLIVCKTYQDYKEELSALYQNWAGIEKDLNFGLHRDIIKESQQIIYLNFGISIGIMIMIIMTMLIIRSFFEGKEKVIIKKEKELKLREKMEQKYRTLFENTIDAIFIADIGTRQLVDCNKAAEKLMGYSRDKLLSMKADELHPKDKIKETMIGFKKQVEGKIKSVLTEVLTKNNKRIPVKINASVVKIGNERYNQGIFRELK